MNETLRLAIDCEYEQPHTNPQTPDSVISEAKLIQIGWVVFNPVTLDVHEESLYHVNIGIPSLSKFI